MQQASLVFQGLKILSRMPLIDLQAFVDIVNCGDRTPDKNLRHVAPLAMAGFLNFTAWGVELSSEMRLVQIKHLLGSAIRARLTIQ